MPVRLTLCAVLFLGCQPAPITHPAPTEPSKDAVLHSATLSTWRRNTPVISARAETVTWYRQDGRFVAETVNAHLPSRDGTVEVKAPHVAGSVNGESLDATGGVVVTSARGHGTSPTAHVENGPEGTVVTSDAGVTFNGPGQTLTARAFRFETNAQQAHFEGVETSAAGAK